MALVSVEKRPDRGTVAVVGVVLAASGERRSSSSSCSLPLLLTRGDEARGVAPPFWAGLAYGLRSLPLSERVREGPARLRAGEKALPLPSPKPSYSMGSLIGCVGPRMNRKYDLDDDDDDDDDADHHANDDEEEDDVWAA